MLSTYEVIPPLPWLYLSNPWAAIHCARCVYNNIDFSERGTGLLEQRSDAGLVLQISSSRYDLGA